MRVRLPALELNLTLYRISACTLTPACVVRAGRELARGAALARHGGRGLGPARAPRECGGRGTRATRHSWGEEGGGRFTTEAAAIPFIIVLLLAEIVQTQILKIVQQTAKKNP